MIAIHISILRFFVSILSLPFSLHAIVRRVCRIQWNILHPFCFKNHREPV